MPPAPPDTGVFHQAGVLGGTVVNLKNTTTTSGSLFNSTPGTPPPKPQFFIRIRNDNAPLPLPSCTSGPGDTCPFDEFVEMVNGPLAAAAGDFIEVCGLTGQTGVGGDGGLSGNGSVVRFLTTKGDGTEVLVGLN